MRDLRPRDLEAHLARELAATHWSTRKMAAVLGVSVATVSRHWRKDGLKPHRVETFKVSRDPQFVEKLEDIVGLCLNPPEHAPVLCCDQKSQGAGAGSHSAWAAGEARPRGDHDP